MNERAEGALTRWTERGPWVSDYAGVQAPSGTSTRPRKGSHAMSGPLSIRVRVRALPFFSLSVKIDPTFPAFFLFPLFFCTFLDVFLFEIYFDCVIIEKNSIVNLLIIIRCKKKIIRIKLSKNHHPLIV